MASTWPVTPPCSPRRLTCRRSSHHHDRQASNRGLPLRHRPQPIQPMQQGVVDGRLDDAGSPQLGDRCLTTRHICGANRATTSRLTHIRYDEVWQSSRGEYGHGCLRDQQSMTRWRHRSSSRRFAWCQRDAHIPVTYCPRAYPRAPLVEDVDADSLISENRGRQCVLYVDSWSCLPLAWWCGGWTRARSWPSDHCASCQHAGVASVVISAYY